MEKYIFYLTEIVDITMPNDNKDIMLSLASGVIGAILGAIMTCVVTYKAIKKEKIYYIEIEIIAEKILNPLIRINECVKRRIQNKRDVLITEEMFNEVQGLFDNNMCWLFIINKKIKPVIYNIKEYAYARDAIQLKDELEKLNNIIEDVFQKRYKSK